MQLKMKKQRVEENTERKKETHRWREERRKGKGRKGKGERKKGER